METAYVSAFAALAGSTLGALTSIGTSWLSQYVQFKTRLHGAEIDGRQELYRTFIEEASRTYAHALEHEEANSSNLVALYALVSRMRISASPEIVESAESVVQQIVDTYLAPNKTLRDVRASMGEDAVMDPLRVFADACRDELRKLRAIRLDGSRRPAARRGFVTGARRAGAAAGTAPRGPAGTPTGTSAPRTAPDAPTALPAAMSAADVIAMDRLATCRERTP